MTKQTRTKIIAMLLVLALVLPLLPGVALATESNSAPEPTGYSVGFYPAYPKIEFSYTDYAYLDAVNQVTVDGTTYAAESYSFNMDEGKYQSAPGSGYLMLGLGDGTYTVVISADGYEDLALNLTFDGSNAFGEVITETSSPEEPEESEEPEEPEESEEPEEPSNQIPPAISSYGTNFGLDFKLTFENQDWLSAITDVTVAGESYTLGSSSYSVWGNTCYYVGDDYSGGKYLLIGEGGNFIDGKAVCIISAEGYINLTLELDKNNHTATVIESELDSPAPEKKPAPNVMVDNSDSGYIQLAVDDENYISGIDSVSINDRACIKQDFKMALNGDQYYLDGNSGYIVFDNFSNCPLKSGDILTVTNPDYEALQLKVAIVGSTITMLPADSDTEQGDEYVLHVRLVGSFEAAIVDQKGYDAISGASTNITQNKNSDVVVEAALTVKDASPTESDWQLLGDSDIQVNTKETAVNLDAASGMIGVYSPYSSALTLAGTPKTPGTYEVFVTITDDQGRTATSNSLLFKVYSGEEYLEDQLTLDNCVQTADGKYMYNMEPWAIKNFDGDDNTVTVPVGVKVWYGSHTSGTYGELGYPISFGSPTVQTLIVPAGCDLTLVNMDILSSVRIVVQDGGRLTLRDTPVQGVVEVLDGGVFSMNYDGYGDEFLMGAAINGQLILQDGATVDNAIIYSNTNYIANGDEARQNSNPVVVVNGDVTMKGQIIIRGDEAPTGSAGQTGLQVNDGAITVPEGSILAVYGGGYSALSHDGGDAVILNNGSITGGGKLIAVGGWSADILGDSTGGNGVSGTGTVSTASAWLQGGSVYQGAVGQPITEGVTLSDNTDRSLVDGKSGPIDYDDPTYWHGTTLDSVPDLIKDYPVKHNAPGTPEVSDVIVDGKSYSSLDEAQMEANDAYLVTVGDETQLVGDTSLKRWLGTWQSWENFIYPNEALSVQYPYLGKAWEQAYQAYMAAFQAAGIDMSTVMPDVAALKAYWAGVATTKGVASIEIAGNETNGYTITWKNENGKVLAADTYVMTGKLLKGFEGAPAYVFTAQTLKDGSPYKYVISMVPGMDGTEEAPIAAHFHFQFGSSLDELLLKGEQYNSTDYGMNANGRPVSSNLANAQWYATMTDAEASVLANYNVILGMHKAEKWTSLPKDDATDNSGSGSDSDTENSYETSTGSNSSSGSGGKNSGSGSRRPAANPSSTSNENSVELADANSLLRNLSAFSDVASDDHYAEAIAWAVEHNITSGTSATTFSPNLACTRAQAVTFLYRMMQGTAESVDGFRDVAADQYYAGAVAWAVKNGIAVGTSKTTFDPDLTVTRAQVVTFLYRTAGSPAVTGENPFQDVKKTDFYHDVILWAVQNGITAGTSATTFSPDAPCTRAQVVTFLYRYMNASAQ